MERPVAYGHSSEELTSRQTCIKASHNEIALQVPCSEVAGKIRHQCHVISTLCHSLREQVPVCHLHEQLKTHISTSAVGQKKKGYFVIM